MTSKDSIPTFRPYRLMWWVAILSVVMVVAGIVGWFFQTPAVRATFNIGQIATLYLFLTVFIGAMAGLALSRVRVKEDGLEVRNVYLTRFYPWHRIDEVRLKPGDPWAYLFLSTEGTGREVDDRERRAMLGIQASDGRQSEVKAAQVRAAFEAHRTPRPTPDPTEGGTNRQSAAEPSTPSDPR